MKTKKYERIDWAALKTEYASSDISYQKLAEKHNVDVNLVNLRGKREGWVEARRKYKEKCINKALDKASTRDANILAAELDCTRELTKIIKGIIKDTDQFHRHLVTTGSNGSIDTEERIYSKADARALKDIAQSLSIIARTQKEILALTQIPDKKDRDAQELQMQKLEEEKKRAEQGNEVHVVFDGDMEKWSE